MRVLLFDFARFGFLAPVLAKEAPAMIIATGLYPPVAGLNGLATIAFMVGYALLGTAMTRTATLPRLSGILVAVGGPAYLLGAGHRADRLTGGLAGRRSGQCESWGRAGLARLSTVAADHRFRLTRLANSAPAKQVLTGLFAESFIGV